MLPDPTPDRDEPEIARLLKAVDGDAAPVDHDALARIGQAAGDLFAMSAAPDSQQTVNRPASSSFSLQPTAYSLAPPRNRPMFFAVTRLLATVSAAVAVLAMWFSADSFTPANIALGDILRPVLDARTLHLKVVQEGVPADVYVKHPGFVRWEEAPTRYRVAQGTNFWRIDGDDTWTDAADADRWVRPDGAIDLLGLLDIDPTDRPSFDRLRPSGRREFAGHDAWVFSRSVVEEDRTLRVELFADAKTNAFLGVTARDAKGPQQGPPLAELTLVALNVALADEAFAVADTLNVLGVGKVTDVQGVVTLRPLISDRWTIVCREAPLEKGDWIRTSPRGAHAARLVLNGGTTLTLGPGTLLEIHDTNKVRLTSGECQVERVAADDAKAGFDIQGPGDAVERVAGGKHLFRVSKDETLTKIDAAPLWLKGFEGATANESIGSLIVTVDGRNEPLTVGEHKVTIDIRDQIARTTIEETFVNRTNSRLEGQFHFPLPQDASISGFGMWIGDQLVEADIVEKQRAREIFETILRENRDPGLLEWAGGNIFKARVFPIEARSEKRIKITYTQVLPLRANRYRYSYGLRSELLQKFPLRELSVQVNVHSAIPLKSVTCPTYPCRTQATANSARLDFTANEFTPQRDFEVVCEVDGAQSQVVAIPHRRGDDGYLLLQLMPPAGEGNWQREVLPSGMPADLLILCDTSGSMDSAMRKTQGEFVTALVSALGPKDRFNVGVCDVETTWLFPEAMTQKDEVLKTVQTTLEERPSLGWTDLDRAIASALDKAQPNTQIVYVGDGIVAGVNSDPQAFAVRVKQLAASRVKTVDGKPQPAATIHSVSVGSTYESVALKGMASIGSGSMRQITGDQTATVVANELLNEIMQPGLKDLAVEFQGIQVAAVYPERLPNLPAGMQQILVGRYLPEGDRQTGEVIVTGTRGTEKVRYAAKISFPDKEEGNSFIPRLWARAHLDQLLMQGSSAFIKDEIIRLSEEFHIITPYTSLLVLESDADRQRFGVKKRYEMRDGERFFADGKGAQRYDLAQQQMQRAGSWRQGLRRQILAGYARLGRNPQTRRPSPYGSYAGRGGASNRWYFNGPSSSPAQGLGFRTSGGVGGMGGGGFDYDFDGSMPIGSPGPGEMQVDGFMLGDSLDKALYAGERLERYDGEVDLQRFGGMMQENELLASIKMPGEKAGLNFFDTELDLGELNGRLQLPELQRSLSQLGDEDEWSTLSTSMGRNLFSSAAWDSPAALDPYGGEFDGLSDMSVLSKRQSYRGISLVERRKSLAAAYDFGFAVSEYQVGQQDYRGYVRHAPAIEWLNLFPVVPAPEPRRAERPAPAWWPAEALELARLLETRERIRALPGGFESVRTTRQYHSGWRRMIEGTTHLSLESPNKWLDLQTGQGDPSTLHWHDGQQRGTLTRSLPFGQVRPMAKGDEESTLSTLSSPTPDRQYRDYVPTIERPADDRAILTLTHRSDARSVVRLTIDTSKKVILKQEALYEGKVVSTSDFSDHVEVGGIWFSTKSVSRDKDGHEIGSSQRTVTLHAPDAFQKRFDAELALRDQTLLLEFPLPKLDVARQKVTAGNASVQDRLVVMAERTARQQWDDVFVQLAAIERALAGKPALPWLRIAVERAAGRHEQTRQGLLAALERAVADGSPDALRRASHAMDTVYAIIGWHEYTAFVAKAKTIYERQKDPALALHEWKQRQADCLRYTGRTAEFLDLRKEYALEVPGDASEQCTYAGFLFEFDRPEAAYAWLDRTLAYSKEMHDRPLDWNDWTFREIHMTRARFLRQQTRWADLVKHLAGWVDQRPIMAEAYQEYASALLFNDQMEEFERTVRQWFTDSQVDRKLPDAERARFDAAISVALNDIPHLSARNIVDPRWVPVLEEAARFFLGHAEHGEDATRILSHHRFQSTDAADRVRGLVRTRLNATVAMLPVNTVSTYVSLLLNQRCLMVLGPDQLNVENVSKAEWTAIAQALRTRWNDEPKLEDRRTLAMTLTSIHALHFAETEYLPFLRTRLQRAEAALAKRPAPANAEAVPEQDREQDDGDYVESERHELYEALLARPWTAQIEDELFAQLPKFDMGAERPDRLMGWIARLHLLVDKLVAARQAASLTVLKDKGETEKLTRTELLAKQKEFEKAAREGIADRLRAEAEKHKADVDQSAWFGMERARLDVLLDRNIEAVWGEMQELLGPAPVVVKPEEEWTLDRIGHEVSLAMLRSRAFTMSLHLAARDKAPAEYATRMLAYLDAGIALGGDAVAGWKQRKFQFLIALDRVEDLERELRAWSTAEPKVVFWRLSLAKVRAERGDVPGAIALLEEVRKEAPLSPTDLAMLTDLYLAADRKGDYEQARLAKFQQIDEWRLSNMIGQFNNRAATHGGDVDENVLLMLEALFAKASHPEQYLYQMRSLYQATRDFRLLRMIPDLTIGRTRETIYRVLQNLDGQVLWDLKEAAADEILVRVKELRAETVKARDAIRPPQADEMPDDARKSSLAERRARELDLRALDLIEGLVERRSAEVPNAADVHVRAALAAFQRAFDGAWEPGERRMMSTLLRNLGKIQQPTLAAEQHREFRELIRQSEPLSDDALWIATDLAHVLYWHYPLETFRGRETGPALLSNVIRDRLQKEKGVWPAELNGVLSEHLGQLRDSGQYTTAEDLLAKIIDALPEQFRPALEAERYATWIHALEHDGRVSLGEKEPLFAELLKRALDRVRSAPDNERYSRIVEVCQLLRTGIDKNFPTATPALSMFAFDTLPTLLTPSMHNHESSISHVASLVGQHLDKREELRFYIERLENYPAWLRYSSSDGWNNFGSGMASLRSELGNVGDLEPRLLKLVLDHLRLELRTREGRNQAFTRVTNGYFWREKEADFARVADEVFAGEKNSPRIIEYVAEYVFHGLNHRARGIEMLFIAQRRGLLDNRGHQTLAKYLTIADRHAEAAPVFELLVDREPDQLEHRTDLMRAYHYSKRPQQLKELYDRTRTEFQQRGLWTTDAIGHMARGCRNVEMWEESRALYADAISRRQRESGNRGIGDAELSNLYRYLADVCAHLNLTAEAVEAASGAIVCWPSGNSQREEALNTLRSVIQRSPDLEAYVATVDAKAKETGQDSPIIRAAIGKAWQGRNEWDKAIAQFQIARQLQPNNRDVNEALLACIDAKGDKVGATGQLLAMIDFDRHNLELLKKLTDRSKDDPKLAERAATALVEASPNEAENHQALAELRQSQDRWPEAIPHWEQVAELRKLEPTGLVRLAQALAHVKQFGRAKEVLEQYRRKEWPSRFDSLQNEVHQLANELNQAD